MLARRRPRSGVRRGGRASPAGVPRAGAAGRGHREGHALAVLARVDGHHMVDRHDDLARHAAEAGLELDELVAQLQRRWWPRSRR